MNNDNRVQQQEQNNAAFPSCTLATYCSCASFQIAVSFHFHRCHFYGRSFISFGGQYQPSTKLAILQTGLLSIQCIKATSWIEELDLCSWDKLASFPLLAHLSRWLRSRDRVVPSGVEPLGNCKGQDNR